MGFEILAEIHAEPASTLVYAEGWQSWSPVAVHRASDSSPRAHSGRQQTMGWRPGRPLPIEGFQGEGVLAVAAPEQPVHAWFAPDPAHHVPSIRLEALGDRVVVSADGPVTDIACEGGLGAALAAVGERIGTGDVRSIPPGWCSWSFYFGGVSERDVVENLEAVRRLELPIEIVQIDDGYATGIGDWLDVAPRFGSLRRTAERIVTAGMQAGIWTAPFLAGARSALATAHPDWLVGGADAGRNWGQRLRVLDVTHPDAAAQLERVYRTLAGWGFTYHKLDFLYAGAIDGRRYGDCSPLSAFTEGLRLIRRAAGSGAILLGCGAPLLPSVGLVDAMRVGPDVLPEGFDEAADESVPGLENAIKVTRARAWMHARLWVNDPDCLVARPGIRERETWASHVGGYGGLTFSSDRLAALDARGLELTRQVLRPSSRTPTVGAAV